LPEGLIIKGVGGLYQIESKEGIFNCKIRGIFRKKGITPLPGDFVEFTIINEKLGEGWIEEIKERKNFFIRPPVANVNMMAIVISVKNPAPDFLLADKLIISAQRNDIEPVIIINKIDLSDKESLSTIEEVYRGTGFTVIPMSKVTMEGYEELYREITNKRTVFAGQSGVGKSTILNNVINSYVMETGDVSSKIQRGRHTTRHVQLLPLKCGGYVADTPGFSLYSLDGIEHDELKWMYPEFDNLNGQCRFNGCNHITEPGCCVKDAVSKGEISKIRYNCYNKLYEELKEQYDKRYK
jgi:ribosome biogenesis GTPase